MRSRLFKYAQLAGLALTLLLTSACDSDDVSRLDRFQPPADSVSLSPARPDAPYAEELGGCARLFERNGSNNFSFCSLERLPLLGQEHQELTPEDVMARALVSHDWMAERFEQALEAMPDDLLQMFRGVTAVVIGSDIRPSYYWLSTGAIYLDPNRLWLEINERDTISREPDFRSDFGQSLNFETLWRYVQNGDYAWETPSLSGPGQARTIDDILAPMAALLFHELAHANDYLPPSTWASLNSGQTPGQAASSLQSDSVSATLANTYPLSSEQMMDLAEVMFSGREATEAERQLDAEQVSLEFRSDTATDPYAYVSNANRQLFLEDTAMMFEEAMMRHHFGVARELAFTSRPESDSASCNDYRIRWGQRNRVADAQVRPRLALILPLLLDQNEVEPYLSSLGAPESMPSDRGWCESLGLEPLELHAEAGGRIDRFDDRPLPEEDRRHGGGRPQHPGH